MKGKVSLDLKLPDLRDAANCFQQSFTLHWKDIEDQLESSKKAIEARDEELRVKEKELEKRNKEVKSKDIQCKKKSKELETSKQSASEALKLKESEVQKRREEVELKEVQCKKRLEALKLKEKEVEKQRKDVELKEIQCKMKLEELERDKQSGQKDLKIKQKRLELRETNLDEQFRVLGSKEMEIKKYKEELNLREQKCESNSKENDSEKKEILASREKLELEKLKFVERVRNEEEKIDQQLKEIELEKKQLLAKEEKIDQKAKGFEMEKASFMERLIELQSKEKQLEVHISGFIRTLIRKNKRIEAIGFAYAFDLVGEFPPVPLLKDFLKFSGIGARKIGRKYKNVDAKIKALNKRIEDVKAALKCIQDHKIVSDISPEGLELQINDLEKQIAATKTKLATPACTASSNQFDVRTQSSPNIAAAVGCKLISAPSTSRKVVSTEAVHPAITTLWHQQTGIKRPRSAIADDSDVPLAEILPQKLVGSSGNEVHCHTSAETIEQPSGESFELLPGEHGVSDSPHTRNSFDDHLDLTPVEYAFDAIKKFCSLERKDDMSASLDISMERCISLLMSLRNMLHLVRVKGEALRFSADWKARLTEMRQCQSEVVLFVEFLAAYGLTSSFPASDLLFLLDANSDRKNALDLFQTLGLADKIPDFIESLIQRNQRIEAAKYVHVLGMNDKFPIIRLLSDHWDYSKKICQGLCEKNNHSIISQIEAMREEREALTAIIKCFEAYNLEPQGQMSPEFLRERIVQLDWQKAEKEVELDKVKPSARTKSISFQQQKKSGNCSTEATPNAGLSAPDICPNPTVVSTPIISPSATSASIDKSSPARTVNLPLNTVSPTLAVRSSAVSTTSTIGTFNSLPTTPTYKLPNGSSPLPTASAAAAKAVAASSTSGPPATTISMTQHQQQGSSPFPTAGVAASEAVHPSSTSGPPSTTISKTVYQQQGSSHLPSAGTAAAKAVLPSSTSGPPSTTIFKAQHQQQGSSPLPTTGAAATKAVVPSTSGPPSTIISKTQHQQQAQNKRRKVVSSGPPLKPKHMNSVVHPIQPPLHQQHPSPLLNRDALCLDRPARYYCLEGDPRTNLRRSSYHDNTSRRCY